MKDTDFTMAKVVISVQPLWLICVYPFKEHLRVGNLAQLLPVLLMGPRSSHRQSHNLGPVKANNGHFCHSRNEVQGCGPHMLM